MIKVLMGYNLAPGFSQEDHDLWLNEVHLPDMARVPGLEKAVINRARQVILGRNAPQYLAELHYPDLETYQAAREWIKENPFPEASRPEGKILIRFMQVCESRKLLG